MQYTKEEVKEIVGFDYKSYAVKNEYLKDQAQYIGNVSTKKDGGYNLYDGCQNLIGTFDAKLNWKSNIGISKIEETWKEAALKVLSANK